MPRIAATALLVLVVAGCAGRSAAPVAVTQLHDSTSDCQAIHAEIQTNGRRIGELTREKGTKAGQNVAAGVAGLFIWPLWFAMDFQGAQQVEIDALEERNRHLAMLGREKC